MYNPTMRLLSMLQLLQSREKVSGDELAKLLEVDERTVRRYIMMLQDMDIPVESERGRGGGYWLCPGFRLPPLMFNADEVTVVMLGLLLTRELGSISSLAVESATAKIERVLPAELHDQALALRQSLILDDANLRTVAVSSQHLIDFSHVIHIRHCMDIMYQSGDGDLTERKIAPYGLVLHARVWYIPAYCYLRQDRRLFRLDRIRSFALAREIFDWPRDFDPRAFVYESLAKMQNAYACEILLDAPLEVTREVIPASLAILESEGDQTLMRCYTDSPDWLARYLARLELPFRVRATDELRAALRALAADLLAGAG
jgi:predicted DNA-binding transcriptional regulator YafY